MMQECGQPCRKLDVVPSPVRAFQQCRPLAFGLVWTRSRSQPMREMACRDSESRAVVEGWDSSALMSVCGGCSHHLHHYSRHVTRFALLQGTGNEAMRIVLARCEVAVMGCWTSSCLRIDHRQCRPLINALRQPSRVRLLAQRRDGRPLTEHARTAGFPPTLMGLHYFGRVLELFCFRGACQSSCDRARRAARPTWQVLVPHACHGRRITSSAGISPRQESRPVMVIGLSSVVMLESLLLQQSTAAAHLGAGDLRYWSAGAVPRSEKPRHYDAGYIKPQHVISDARRGPASWAHCRPP